ncbi:hypothetical protein ES705_32355 [subsurface metagenome]
MTTGIQALHPAIAPGIANAADLLRTISFHQYVLLLKQRGNTTPVDMAVYEKYSQVWARLWDFKRDWLTLPVVWSLFVQLLTGCRVSALPGAVVAIDSESASLSIPATKGGFANLHEYGSLPSPLTNLLLRQGPTMTVATYWQYRSELRNGNPNFFQSGRPGCQNCTHMPRYLFIQILYYVLGVSLGHITKLMGWRSEGSIEPYLNTNI